jgi:hypothetical protein
MQPDPPGHNPYAPPVAAPRAPSGTDAPPGPGRLSIDGAFGRAFDTMKRFLFRPFNFGKLFVFGFIVWLAEMGEGGTSMPTNFNLPSGGGGTGGGGSAPVPDFSEVFVWLRDNEATVITLAVVGGIVFVAFSVLASWLSARGTMMALRAIALDHTRLGEHWKETREAAWAYFGFRMLLAAIALPIAVGTIVWGLFAFLAVSRTSAADYMDYLVAVLPPVAVLLVSSLLLAPVHFLGRNLLAPMLLIFRDGLRANWSRTMHVVRTSFGGVVLFLLVRMLIAVVQGICETIAVYITCCIGGLPVLHQVVTAPFTAFERAYTLHVLESLGLQYKLILDPPPWQPPYPQPPYGQPPPAPYPGYPPYPSAPPGAPR